MNRAAVAALCCIALPAAAQPSLARLSAPPLSSRPSCDEHTFYLEPTLMVVDDGERASLFHRAAGGARFHNCDPDGAGRLEGRIGATLYLSGEQRAQAGIGLESELDFAPARGPDRIGLRLGYESANEGGRMYTLGLRYRPSVGSLAVDAFIVRNSFESVSGVMIGFGVEGKPGRYVIATEAIITAFLFALVLADCTGRNGC